MIIYLKKVLAYLLATDTFDRISFFLVDERDVSNNHIDSNYFNLNRLNKSILTDDIYGILYHYDYLTKKGQSLDNQKSCR